MPQSHKGTVSIWLAPKSIEPSPWSEYVDEHYCDDTIPYRDVPDMTAKSHFEADYSISYDHDFVEGNFRKTAIDIDKLIKPCSYSASFLDAAVRAAKAKRIAKSNAVLLIYDFGFDQKDADNQLAASRFSDWYNKRAILRFVGSVPYSPPEEPAPSIDLSKKKRVALTRVKRDHLELEISFDVWGVERDGNTLHFYRGKRVDKTTKSERQYADVSKAKAAMERWINKKLEAGFKLNSWPRGGFKPK